MRASVLLRTPPARGHVPNLALGRPFLQRKCADCSDVPFGSALQRKVIMGASNDPLEREADRIAEGMVAVPTEASLHGASLPIQRAGRPAGQDAAAPASVDHALSGPGRPLWPVLRQVMEQRFRHDFSGVRVHADAAAMQSARAGTLRDLRNVARFIPRRGYVHR